jgi:methylated-DNA-[protein]-cysteine S-methyltransferase
MTARTTPTTPTTPPEVATIDSPFGTIVVEVDDGAVVRLELTDGPPAPTSTAPPTDPVLAAATAQVREYLAGERTSFDLPLRPAGTPFQQDVWAELQRIPYGTTITYAELADRVGRPRAHRAVGSANGANPIAIVVPCHRVVATGGGLGGYAYGTDTKRRLLDLERGTASLL